MREISGERIGAKWEQKLPSPRVIETQPDWSDASRGRNWQKEDLKDREIPVPRRGVPGPRRHRARGSLTDEHAPARLFARYSCSTKRAR